MPLLPRRGPSRVDVPVVAAEAVPPQLRTPKPAAWWIVPVTLLVGGVIVGVAWLLLGAGWSAVEATARQGAIQTTLAAGAGVGAAVTLMLAFRRQRHQEHAAHVTAYLAEKVADNTKHDATERRVTELYTKAAEQLGSDKAAVRLAGLYALERLAQDNPGHRQTIVNVICAYLRMPYVIPDLTERPLSRREVLHATLRRYYALRTVLPQRTAPSRAPADDRSPGHDVEGERQVRLTAQHIMAEHLRDGRPLDARKTIPADPHFWDGIRIDLTGAVLIDFAFDHCSTVEAEFTKATFVGFAVFSRAIFNGYAGFKEAIFTGHAQFAEATFGGFAQFVETTFGQSADFEEVTFSDLAQFWGSSFREEAEFVETSFRQDARFREVTFSGKTRFDRATFGGDAEFDNTVVITPDMEHSWPTRWQAVIQPDGTGRLSQVADESTLAIE